jgi:hypothetical protein
LENHLHSTALACGTDGCEVAQSQPEAFLPWHVSGDFDNWILYEVHVRDKRGIVKDTTVKTWIFNMASLLTCLDRDI